MRRDDLRNPYVTFIPQLCSMNSPPDLLQCEFLQCDPTDPTQDEARAMRNWGPEVERDSLKTTQLFRGLLSVEV